MGSKSVQPDVSRRTVRAATEEMTVFEETRALFEVIGESGKIYTVDLAGPACTCPDFEYREKVTECKHIRMVRLENRQINIDALEAEFVSAAEEFEEKAAKLEAKAQDLRSPATTLRTAGERLQEVGR